jgi:hypothetical protein
VCAMTGSNWLLLLISWLNLSCIRSAIVPVFVCTDDLIVKVLKSATVVDEIHEIRILFT